MGEKRSEICRHCKVEVPVDSDYVMLWLEHAEADAKPESTEGGRRVSVLKRQEGAPVNLG